MVRVLLLQNKPIPAKDDTLWSAILCYTPAIFRDLFSREEV
jgi:hypothetical protein